MQLMPLLASVSQKTTNFDMAKWKCEAKLHCEEGIKAKFMQNVPLCTYLLNTRSKKIVECSADKLWGTGIQLHEEDCLNPSIRAGQGLLGEILENICSSITDILGSNTQRNSMDTTV